MPAMAWFAPKCVVANAMRTWGTSLKTGRLLPSRNPARAKVLEWLMWQMANVGPMLGQANHFANTAAEKIPYAIERYQKETKRLYKVLDHRLADREYLAGDYSIADIATWPWVTLHGWAGVDIDDLPNLERWIQRVGDRPAERRRGRVAG